MDLTSRIAVVDAEAGDAERLERLCSTLPVRICGGAADAGAIVERAQGAEILVTLYTYTRVTAEVLDALPALRLVVTRTAGHSHIDVAAARRNGVAVATVPDAPTIAVAEYAFGTLLAARRRLFDAVAGVRDGRWEFTAHRGSDLHGSTLGVVGLGRIGRRVAELGAAFGMEVVGWSRRAPVPPGVLAVERDELLARADVISLNVALSAETEAMIGAREIAQMKPTAWILNTARGEVLDLAALVAALRDGRLAGACLDVLPGEPVDAAVLAGLRDVPNLYVTPHVSWHTDGTLERQFDGVTDTILAFCAGHRVDLVTP